MNQQRQRTRVETLMSVAGLVLVLLVIIATDVRVREQVAGIAQGSPTTEVRSAGARARAAASTSYLAGRDQLVERSPRMLFVGAAVVLFFFMLRK